MLWQIVVVLVLTILNGFFSMSEIALVTVRKTRIAALVKQGNRRAKVVHYLQQNPESLFATIQVGITLLTITASAFAGSRIARELAANLEMVNIAFVAEHGYAISLIIVVAIISYISLVVGELVPKSLGLRYSETFALLFAYPIFWLSKISWVLVKGLNFSSNLFLRFFKDSTSFTESRLSEEEIRSLLSEGRKAGTIEPHEHHIIENVFDFSDMSVDKVMIPRTQMTAFNISHSAQELVHKAIDSGYSRIPVYEGSVNNILGVLYTKRLLARFDHGSHNLNIKDFLVPPYFVPGTMKISEVLQRLQRKKAQMAMVTDEHGEIQGLVTMEDILEEIVGDISDETDEVDKGIKAEGEGFIVAGDVSILDFNKFLKTHLPEQEDYNTVSGFILDRLGRFAKEGDIVEYKNIIFTVKEVTLRIVKIASVKIL